MGRTLIATKKGERCNNDKAVLAFLCGSRLR